MDNRNNTDPGDSSRLYPDPQHKKCSQMCLDSRSGRSYTSETTVKVEKIGVDPMSIRPDNPWFR